jgi:hypothetical protein
VPNGGTGDTTFTANELLASGTTATGAFQQIGQGTAGQYLASAGAGNLPVMESLPVWTPTDQGLIAWNYDVGNSANLGSNPLATAGTMYVQAMRVPAAASVTNILLALVTNGGTLTSAQCFAALYQGAGGALIGRTADQAANWGAGAAKMITAPLSGGPFNVAAGIVYVGMWFNGTTGPAFTRLLTVSGVANVGLADAASRWGTANTGLTNAASTPGTLGTVTAAGFVAAWWAGIS